MKLRLKGSSLRLRVTRSELGRLQEGERIEETVLFPASSGTSLMYALEVGSHPQPVQVTFNSHRIVVSVSEDQITSWSGQDQVGIYASLPVTAGTNLEVAIEKDFACLDLSDADNEDTFSNPMAGKSC
jgi:hypothetical protein